MGVENEKEEETEKAEAEWGIRREHWGVIGPSVITRVEESGMHCIESSSDSQYNDSDTDIKIIVKIDIAIINSTILYHLYHSNCRSTDR